MSQQPTLSNLAERFYQRMHIRNFAASTIKLRREYLGQFLQWLDDRGITSIDEVTRDVLLAYQRYVYHFRSKRTGKPLKFSTQMTRLVPVRSWFRFLSREQLIASNPASDLDFPKEEQRLPGRVLTVETIESIMSQPDVSQPLGLRNRAILETFYATGMRRSELIALSMCDIDVERQVVTIRQGKGKKDRNMPIGKRALAWIGKYQQEVRHQLAERTSTNVLFISSRGRPFGPTNLSILVRGYITAAGVTAPGSCHLFRHAVATLMLEQGADLRTLQSLLGHAELTTTQIYTHVSIQHLKDVYRQTHPAERPDGGGAESVALSSDGGSTCDGLPPHPQPLLPLSFAVESLLMERYWRERGGRREPEWS